MTPKCSSDPCWDLKDESRQIVISHLKIELLPRDKTKEKTIFTAINLNIYSFKKFFYFVLFNFAFLLCCITFLFLSSV